MEFKTPGNFVTVTEKPIWDKPIEDRSELIAKYRPVSAVIKPNISTTEKREPPVVCVESTAYGKAALDQESRRVRAARVGTRNRTLYTAARCIGELIAGGDVLESDARVSLEAAGRYHGLAERDIRNGIENGLRDGMMKPRAAPKATIIANENWIKVVRRRG